MSPNSLSGATILVPCYIVKSLQSIWRTGTHHGYTAYYHIAFQEHQIRPQSMTVFRISWGNPCSLGFVSIEDLIIMYRDSRHPSHLVSYNGNPFVDNWVSLYWPPHPHLKPTKGDKDISWCRHQMETFSALMALCVGNSPVTGEFPSQRPVTRSVGVFFDLHLNKWLSKQSKRRWLETHSHSSWHNCNVRRHFLEPTEWPRIEVDSPPPWRASIQPTRYIIWNWFTPRSGDMHSRCCLIFTYTYNSMTYHRL